MAVEMARDQSGANGLLNLRGQFFADFADFAFAVFRIAKEISRLINQAGARLAPKYGAPAIFFSFTGEREMDAEIASRLTFCIFRSLTKAGTRHHGTS